ncbi:MAG: PLP-dependent aminotransferase family protein [Acidobacteriota bacterium]
MKAAMGPVFRARMLDDSSSVPRYRRLYELLRRALLDGTIPPGSRLPSTRTLADDLGVSRNTVTAAFDMLVEHELIESRVGAGSYASPNLAWTRTTAAQSDGSRATERPTPKREISQRAAQLITDAQARDPDHPSAFSVGLPALDAFPLTTWRRIVARRARQSTVQGLRHGDPQGDPRLRTLIARHLITARGVHCEASQVVILPSAQMGLDLASRVLLDPGDTVWIEDPGYLGARGALRTAGAHLVPVPVDHEGLQIDEGESRAPNARLAYVTPSHQFPSGVSMSLRRRLKLLAWAENTDAWILEDDYDSEYRYTGTADQALQGLDRAARVLYLGTFSKVLFPALRLAYLVLPDDLVEPFVAARFLTDGHVVPASQEALADFIEAGHLVSHIRRMRKLYHRRRDVLLEEGQRRFHDRLTFVSGAEAGMHITARLHDGDDQELARAAATHGIDLAPLSRYFLGSQPTHGVTFGYAHLTPETIVEACAIVEKVLDPRWNRND